MALEVEPLLSAVGIMIVAAFLAFQGFRKWRLPDVLVLIGLGVLLAHLELVDVELFKAITPLVGTVAIVVILFDGGREIRVQDLGGGVAQGSLLALLVFSATALLCAGIGIFVAGLAPPQAALLGMTFGGAGAVITIPLIQHLHVKPLTVTIVALEAAVSDVLVIVGVVGLSTALTLAETHALDFARDLASTFLIGIAVGVGAGYGWGKILPKPALQGHAYMLTLAVLFMVYVVTELLHGSGPLAVLAFGLVIGNTRRLEEVAEFRTRTSKEKSKVLEMRQQPVFTEGLASFHHEAVFFIRAFFFTSLGVTLDLEVFREPRFLLVGFLLALGVALGRYWGVMLLFWRKGMPEWDRAAMTLMFPLGLAAAALSQVPLARFNIEGTERFPSYAAVAIVITNLVAGILVWYLSRPSIRGRFDRPAPMPAPKTRKPLKGETRHPAPVVATQRPRDPPGSS